MNDIFKIAVNTGTVTPSKPKAVAEQRKSEKADKPEERRNHYRRQRAILNFIPRLVQAIFKAQYSWFVQSFVYCGSGFSRELMFTLFAA
jgi:hypothetical protein